MKCPHCDAVSQSIVAYETNLLGYLIAVFAILVFGSLSLLMMPFLVGLTKQAVHKCAKCLNDVKQSSMFGLNSLEDKVIAKKIGNFGIILTRKYLLYIVAVIAAFTGIYTFILVEEKHHGHRKYTNFKFYISFSFCIGRISDLTWETFKDQCGFEKF